MMVDRFSSAPSTYTSAVQLYDDINMVNKKRLAAPATVEPPAKKAKVKADDSTKSSTSKRIAPSLLETTVEVDFPRGRAPRTAPSSSGPAAAGRRDDGDLFTTDGSKDIEAIDRERSKRRKIERAKTQQRLEQANAPKTPTDTLRVEHLNYKRLIPGTKLLAQIVAISELELIVSLPNQLLGHVPLISISRYLTERLENLAKSDDGSDKEDDDDSDEEADNDVPSLRRLFAVGQCVTAIVTAVQTATEAKIATSGSRRGDENYRGSRRVELSLDPVKVNEGVTRADLTTGFPITAAVKSVEDNGYVLELGLEGITSFIAFDAAQKAFAGRLVVGQLIAARIAKVSSNGRTATLKLDDKANKTSLVETPPTVSAVLPGILVQALVTAVVPSGLNVKFLGFFDGTVDLFHLARAGDVTKSYKAGEKIRARVIASLPTQAPKLFSLTTLPHLLSLSPALSNAPAIGSFVDGVNVTRVEREWGLSVKLPGRPTADGFVHISRVADDRVEQLSAHSGPWQTGTSHRARVIGFSSVDALIQLSLQPSILEQAFMRVSDVQVGEQVKGTIKRLADNALFVSISGNVDAVVWPPHYSDLKLKHVERKFREGATVKARIFSVDPDRNRITLTLKKSLLTSTLPTFSSTAQLEVGAIVDGVVSKVLDKALLLDLFGGMRAFVPIAEVSEGYIDDLSKTIALGQTVQARVMAVDPATQRIDASIRKAASTAPLPVSVTGIELGARTVGVVEAIHPENLVVRIEPWNAIGLLSISTLSRYRNIPEDEVRASSPVGHRIDDLVVLSKNEARSFVIVGFPRPSNARLGIAKDIIAVDTLEIGQALPVKIVSKDQHGLLVQISRNLRGRLHWTDIADDYDQVSAVLALAGSSEQVQAVIVSLDREASKIDMSMRRSLSEEDGAVRDPLFAGLDDVTEGMRIRGFVKNISDSGLFVAIGRGVTARVQIKELFDDYVEDWKSRFALGQVVEGTLTSISVAKKQVEMRLRSADGAKRAPDAVQLGDLKQGSVVHCTVKRVTPYGAFLRIDKSSISGLCHKSEVTDGKQDKWSEGLIEGAPVRALVLEANAATRKISFSIKPSRLPAEEDEMDVDEPEPPTLTSLLRQGESDEEDESDVEIDLGFESDALSEDGAAFAASVLPPRSRSKASKVSPLKVGSFNWAGDSSVTKATPRDDDDASSSEDEAPAPIASTSRLPDGAAGPASATEFEHVLVDDPNSSQLWIRYMHFYLDASDLVKAREVAERALQTIHYREEEEKLNVWTAILNLENSYGTPASREDAFTNALQCNDPLSVYFKMVDILETSRKYGEVEDVFARALKKLSSAPELWIRFAQYYFGRGKATEARELLPRSLKSLPKSKHVETITKFAQLEFKLGEAERGRTIFEGILDSYPKRLDLWNIFVDMEARANNVQGVRSLFERVLQRKLSSKKTRSSLKKWLAIEKEQGDEAGVEAVKQRARDYVAQQAADEGAGVDEE